jgi:hypothetical protein
MKSTRNIRYWFAVDGPETEEQRSDLMRALAAIGEYGEYEVKMHFTVTGPSGMPLKLPNNDERLFLLEGVANFDVAKIGMEEEPAGA